MKKTADASDLSVGYFPTGVSYADRSRERNGDYLKLAFLPYDALELEWIGSASRMPRALRDAILDDASQIIARRGEDLRVSTAGQTARLGRGASSGKTPAQIRREIEAELGRPAVGRRRS